MEHKVACTILSVLFIITGCCHDPYRQVKLTLEYYRPMKETVSFLVICVDACRLDYTSCKELVRTIAKHPANGSKNGDVGHAWIYLRGWLDGEWIEIEGGHSGELGLIK